MSISKQYTADDMIPMSSWGKDHWSMLGYIESVMVETGGFQVGFDGRMRQNRRNFRVMKEECPKPNRPSNCSIGVPMDSEKYGTRLNTGSSVSGHDDWCCVQDMLAEGLFSVKENSELQPGDTLHFSKIGSFISSELRQHKMNGGTFSNFNHKK